MKRPVWALDALRLVTLLACAELSYGAVVNASVAYYVDETLHTVLTSDSTTDLYISESASFTAPSGSKMSGMAGFDHGRFFAGSTLVRAGAFGFGETLTSSSNFRDVLTIDTGTCPIGGPACELVFQYTATGTFFATGSTQAAGQLDFAVLNPLTPGDRSTWLVDKPVFLVPGPVSVTDSASIPFFDSEPFVFWPVFSTVARKVAGADGTSTLDFLNSLQFDSFVVETPAGTPAAVPIQAESGLIYSTTGLAAVPEPGSMLLAVSALALIAWRRKSVLAHWAR